MEKGSRWWAFIKKSIKGPLYARDVAMLAGFEKTTLVCPENALGQWREAHLEPAFQEIFNIPVRFQKEPELPLRVMGEQVENKSLRNLLEKAILKNSKLEEEVKNLKREYFHEKKRFEQETGKKESEIANLAEKIKHAAAHARSAQAEHPSWETLYKTLKVKLNGLTEEIGEKNEEISRLKCQMRETGEKQNESAKRLLAEKDKRISNLIEEIKILKSHLEEKDFIVNSCDENLRSIAKKNEELQKIMLDGRKDYEIEISKFCEEIGRLKGEIRWKNQEIGQIKDELFATMNKIKEFEATEGLRTKQQRELYDAIRAKIKILSGYFENLENKLKYAFKKV
ncbi:MAG: hypothetical protein HY746_10020 [Elusimicrobia bacterium]|nr:hypothetical protein [Elusimicrobiota bacterium]